MTFLDTLADNLYLADNKVLYALILFLILVAIIKVVLYFTKKVFLGLAQKTKTEIDDQIVIRTNRPLFYVLSAAALRFCLMIIPMDIDWAIFIGRLLDSILVLFVTFGVHIITSVILEHYVKKIHRHDESSFHSELIPFTNNMTKILYGMIAFIVILWIWNVNVVPLLAGLGIVGITIGLALQNTLSNVFGGVSLLLDRTFTIGDEIKMDDIEGVVIDVGLRSTKIRTKNNELIIVPNNILANTKITNYARPTTNLRIGIEFIAKKGFDIKKIQKMIEQKAAKIAYIEKNTKPEFTIITIDKDSVKISAYFWINLVNVNKNHAREELYKLVYDVVQR